MVLFHLTARRSTTVASAGTGSSSSGGMTGSLPAFTSAAVSTGAVGIGLIGMLGSVGLTITWGSAAAGQRRLSPRPGHCTRRGSLFWKSKPRTVRAKEVAYNIVLCAGALCTRGQESQRG